MKEKDLERLVVKMAADRGWLSFKFASPAHRGVPDRIFMQAGIVCFIEFKAPGKRPTTLQHHVIEQIRGKDVPCAWFDNAEEAVRFLDSLLRNSPR